jgi:hypothetical protein
MRKIFETSSLHDQIWFEICHLEGLLTRKINLYKYIYSFYISIISSAEAPSLFGHGHRRQHSRHRHVRHHQLTPPEPVAPRRSVLAPGQRSSVPAHLPATADHVSQQI